jgi:hypothetical protein
MPLRELAKKAGYWLGGHLFEGLLDTLCEWLVRALAALVAALLSGLLGVASRHGTATPLRHLLPAAESTAVRAAARPPPSQRGRGLVAPSTHSLRASAPSPPISASAPQPAGHAAR